MIKESNMHDLKTYGKSAIRPTRVVQAYGKERLKIKIPFLVHHPSGNEPLRGFEHRILTEKDALAVHVRSFVTDDVMLAFWNKIHTRL